MIGTATVAEHLDDCAEAVIASWRSLQRQSGDVPRSDSLTPSEFIDHIPSLIDRMAERLKGRPADVAATANRHGHERWAQGYDVSEVVAELGHLRTALIQATFACARENAFDFDRLESAHLAINDVLNEAAAESVRQFQDDGEDRARATLSEVEHRGRAVEQARSEAEAERIKLRALLESLPVGVWVADADGRIVSLNRQAEAIQEFPAEDTIDRVNIRVATPIFQVSRPDGTGYRPSEIPLSRALEGEVIDQEEMIWSQAQGTRVILANARPLLDSEGEIAGAVVVAQDITARKHLESDLVSTTSQLAGIIEQSPVMIWRTGPDGLTNFVNRTFLEYVGMALEDCVGDGWRRAVLPEDREAMSGAFLAAFEAKAPFSQQFRVQKRDGQYRWIVSRGVPYHGENGLFLGYLGSCLDVNDQHELEAALQRQREMAEESSHHKTRLMAALSHDARTPLNAVVLSAQLLEMHVREGGGGGDPEVEQCLRTIRNGVRNVLDLLGDLLDLTRIDAGAMPKEITRFALDEAMAECVSSVETQARIKGLECRYEPDGLLGLTIETDRSKLKQILANFLSNALRYTKEGRIRFYGERDADAVKISVEDTGMGISPVDQARVFDEFATLENPHRVAGEGTGLGLAICRRLALLLGGEILLKSAVGRGSTFTLVLPASALREDGEPESPSEATLDVPRAASILVVEDHDDSRQLLARVLSRMGYRVVEAENGREALAAARAERPLVIFMDVNMPVMDGIDATLALRDDPGLKDVIIFALTGDVSPDNQRRIGEAGVQGYVEKPVTAEALHKVLAKLAIPSR